MKTASCWSCERRWCSRLEQRRWKTVRSTRETQRKCPYEVVRDMRYLWIKKTSGQRKIKNMLAFLHLYIVNRVCILHADINLFLHAVVFIHKQFVTFRSMQIILKRSRLRAQPRLLQWTKKAHAATNGGFLIKNSTSLSHQREPTREPLAVKFIVQWERRVTWTKRHPAQVA